MPSAQKRPSSSGRDIDVELDDNPTAPMAKGSTRLESFIRRLTAQRDILDLACIRIAGRIGPAMELGLGNGRTYDHLRIRMPRRRIIAFDRALAAHQISVPSEDDLVLGEISQTALGFRGIGAALVHADIGTGYVDADALTLEWLPQLTVDLLLPSGVAVSGLPLVHSDLTPLELPASVAKDRYFFYEKIDTAR